MQMSSEPSVDDSLENFGDEIEIGYRSIACKVIVGQGIFFRKWLYNGSFKRRRKSAFRERKVDDSGDR